MKTSLGLFVGIAAAALVLCLSPSAQAEFRPLGSVTYEPEPADLKVGTFEIRPEDRRRIHLAHPAGQINGRPKPDARMGVDLGDQRDRVRVHRRPELKPEDSVQTQRIGCTNRQG